MLRRSCNFNMADPTLNADRHKAATLIARWLQGSITNWQLEDEWPEQSTDRGVVDIGRAMWTLYPDFPERPLKPSNLDPEHLALLQRCLSFLRSDASYEAVPYEEATQWKPNLLTRLLGVKERPWETMRLKIEPERQKWWPFANEAQWRAVQP